MDESRPARRGPDGINSQRGQFHLHVLVTGDDVVKLVWFEPAANNWSFRSGSLRLSNTGIVSSTSDGAELAPGTTYSLIGTAVFGRGRDRSTVKGTLDFRTCGTG